MALLLYTLIFTGWIEGTAALFPWTYDVDAFGGRWTREGEDECERPVSVVISEYIYFIFSKYIRIQISYIHLKERKIINNSKNTWFL